MSKIFSEGYLKHPGLGDIKLGSGTAPNEENYIFLAKDAFLKGYRPDLDHCVRSMEEANIARCLLISGLDYIYEPEAFPLITTIGADLFKSKRTSYTPDFFVPDTGDYIEVKGRWRPRSIGIRALMKLVMFREQHPDKKLVLIHSYDYRQDFPGLGLNVKEEILIPDMKEVFAVPIKEHPDLFFWETGNKNSGYNIYTCPSYFGQESDIDDDKRYCHIMWWKTPRIAGRLFSEIDKHEKELEYAESDLYYIEREFESYIKDKEIEHAERELYDLERGLEPYIKDNDWGSSSFSMSVDSINDRIESAKSRISSMYRIVREFEYNPYTNLSEFWEFEQSVEIMLGRIKTDTKELKKEYKRYDKRRRFKV